MNLSAETLVCPNDHRDCINTPEGMGFHLISGNLGFIESDRCGNCPRRDDISDRVSWESLVRKTPELGRQARAYHKSALRHLIFLPS